MSDQAGGQKIGGTAGSIGGAALGSTFGPVGTIVGGGIGGYLGSAIGGKIGSLFGGQSAPSGPSAEQLQAMKDEQALRDRLTAIATGQGPSAAGIQLGAGLDQIQHNAATMAAGATGNGGVLARYGAMQAGAQAGAQANQAQALARAQEIANANSQLVGLTGGTLGTTTAANTAANTLDFDKTKTYLGSGLQLLSGSGGFLASSKSPAGAVTPGASAGPASSAPSATAPSVSGGVPQAIDDEIPV